MNKRVKRGGNARQRRVTVRGQLRECGRQLTEVLKRRQEEMAREVMDIPVVSQPLLPDVFVPGDDLQVTRADGAIEFDARLALSWDNPNAAPEADDPTPDWPVYDELEDERPVAEPIEFDSSSFVPESAVPFGSVPDEQFGASRRISTVGWGGSSVFGPFGDFEPDGFSGAVAAYQAASRTPESFEVETTPAKLSRFERFLAGELAAYQAPAKPSWFKRVWAKLLGAGNSPL
ncbi:MAG: hypothetical protein WC517_00615 [Patescibacteria group bacterium]